MNMCDVWVKQRKSISSCVGWTRWCVAQSQTPVDIVLIYIEYLLSVATHGHYGLDR
jgi:hypothetical protein